MKKLTAALLWGGLTLGFAATAPASAAAPADRPGQPRYASTDAPVEERVEDALRRLTLEEKVALCHAQSKFSSRGVPRLGIPELWMSDGPHGVRAEIEWDSWGYARWTNDSCTAFPALTCLAATWNPALAERYGRAVGAEARYRRKDVLLGPGLNICRTPLNGRNFEYMGEDPLLAGVMAVPYIRGVQSNGVAACVKHYALNNQETNRMSVDVEVSDRALYEIYLPAFRRAAVEGGAWSFMGSYNRYRGQHGCHNRRLIRDILKQEWGYDGALISDWGGTHDTQEAADNGLDIEMGTGTNGLTWSASNAYDNYYLALPYLQALREGRASTADLDDKVRRVLRLNFRTAMAERPWGSFATEEHASTARAIASEGIVLLKNDGLLPVDPAAGLRIAVIGDNATRSMTAAGGSSELKTWREISPLQAVEECYGRERVTYSLGYHAGPSAYGRVIPSPLDADSLRRAAVATAREADVVFFFGGLNKSHQQDCEDGDRQEYALPYGQERLIREIAAVNPNVAVVLISGSAVETAWSPAVRGLVQAWYGGSEAGHAVVDILSGAVNPSGKLPVSFYTRLEDCGAHAFGPESYPGVDRHQTYSEDLLVGYRWLEAKRTAAAYPFGFGLSYTTFRVGKPVADRKTYADDATIRVTVEVANTGARAGQEVVQLYVGKVKSAVVRAPKELKAFRKVALAAGEQTAVTLEVPVRELAYYDAESRSWRVEKGDYTVWAGNSSRDVQGVKIRIE